jgi:hypothetical protein
MLDKYLNLIQKYPKRLAIGGGLWLLICLVSMISSPKTEQPRIQEQTQSQNPLSDSSSDVNTEPFDRSKCKVYYAGVLLGANVFWFKHGSGGTYLMFTDSDQLVDRYQNRGMGIWLTKSDFLNLLGNDLMQQMEPEVKEVFARRLDGASYVAVVDDSLTTKAIGSANICVR